ncbi:MAG: PD40 domain-containing protein [Ignavibacteria bacterium]|nr:PD40 domain-containing protein [Ignavibacteria bacterium]
MMFFSSIILGSMILGLANSAVQAPVPVESCNTSSSEYAPNFDPRSGYMVFTSERSGTAAVYRIMMQPGTKAEPFPGTFNSEDQHRGFISFTSSGEAVGVAYGQYEEQSFPGIVTAPRDNGALNLGHPLTALNGPFFVSHPAISPDGTRLVFVSDRVGGEGGLDLWISDRRDDLSWSTPIGLGRAVNSIEDEISPTFLSSDTLLFASNGIGGAREDSTSSSASSGTGLGRNPSPLIGSTPSSTKAIASSSPMAHRCLPPTDPAAPAG